MLIDRCFHSLNKDNQSFVDRVKNRRMSSVVCQSKKNTTKNGQKMMTSVDEINELLKIKN